MSQPEPMITEVNKDTFWTLIDQAKEHPGGPSEWLIERLMDLGPENAKRFDDIACAYSGLAYQYGLWTAASVIERGGCTDDGFIDFRGWLVAQGKDVYMAALKDPDSLADAPDYQDQRFDSLPHMGERAYEELTGRSTYEDFDPAGFQALKAELEKEIVYGDGIGYPYDAADVPAYLPRLCRRYLPERAFQKQKVDIGTWNLTNPEIMKARATAPKSKKVKKNRGDER
ncbi:DUF4240 domain-containing protein [Oscillibacter sp.]|uniref:DUF4240 domain-containing protein n=1 Tax=Oscillibacter sp. TaxID=1945593 RepID=UPI002D7E29BB|nr:DUF4240 domain-containing protein [Oscillibacter sp.]